MISKVCLVALLVGFSSQQACNSHEDCSTGSLCYSVSCGLTAYQECISDVSVVAQDCELQTVKDLIPCDAIEGCKDGLTCAIQTCQSSGESKSNNMFCTGTSNLGTTLGACSWSETPFLPGLVSLQQTNITFNFEDYLCEQLTCEDYDSLIGDPTCCATINNCQTDTQYNGGSYCVPPTTAFGQAGYYMDPTCTALCNNPDEAVCTNTAYSGNSESECAAYGDKYCCMVMQYNDTESTYGTCNKEKDVDTDQKDGYAVICQAVLGFVGSMTGLIFALLH